MIHSLAGGVLSDNKKLDFAKVEILSDYYSGTFWYITEIPNLKVGDVVVVPFGEREIFVEGKVLKIDKNISSQTAPIPIKRAKKILKRK